MPDLEKFKKLKDQTKSQQSKIINQYKTVIRHNLPKKFNLIEATPAAFEVLLCEPQNPTKTKPSKSKRKQKEQEIEETLQEQNPEIRDFLLKHWSSICSYTRLGPVQDIFNFYFDRIFRDLVDIILTKII